MYLTQQFFEEISFPRDNIIIASERSNDDGCFPSHLYLSTVPPYDSDDHISFHIPEDIPIKGSYLCYLNLYNRLEKSGLGSWIYHMRKDWSLIQYAMSMPGFKIVDQHRIYFFLNDYSQLFKMMTKLMTETEYEPDSYVLLYRLHDLKELDLVDLYLKSEVFVKAIDIKQSWLIGHILSLVDYLLGLSFNQVVKWLAELKLISGKLRYIETKVIINPVIIHDINNSSTLNQISKDKQIMVDFFPNCFLICNECHIDIHCASCNTSEIVIE